METAHYIAQKLGDKVLYNLWIGDGFKNVPADRLSPRLRLKDSLDQIFAKRYDDVICAVESKVFGIGLESFTVGSNEFYQNYAAKNNICCLLDNGHYHPTEVVSDKIPSLLAFSDYVALHVTRPVRWDSDHVVLFEDELKEIAKEIVRNNATDRVLIGLDYFDASINRIAAWVTGQRAMYIGEKYREQINLFCITTNGTIVPSEQILKLCKKYNVLFRISNYTVALPRLERNIRLLVEALEKYEITYILNNPDLAWMDYGFESFERVDDENEWIKAFSECGTPCREVRNSHYYYCVMARSVSENLNFGVGEDDYLDLRELDGAGYKKRLLEYNLGYSNKGYLDMCRYCRGKDANNYPIPAAEQVKL